MLRVNSPLLGRNCAMTVMNLTFTFFSMAFPAHSGPWPLIQFRNHLKQTVGLIGLVIIPPQHRYLHTGQHKHRINAYAHQTTMP
jgi:hypothetical protein